jgi:predicted nucleic acid-binding protein
MGANSRIFVDSNYFIALFNFQDSLYRKARKTARSLDAKRPQLVISNFIFLEVTTVLSQKRGKSVALEAGRYLAKSSFIEIIHIDEFLHQQTWEIFQAIKYKDISFVDASTLAVLRVEGIAELLTFDIEDFKKLQKNFRFRLYSKIS